MPKTIYLAGALKNWEIVTLAVELEKLGFEVFADWMTPGPEADSFLLEYAKLRGWSYKQTLASHAATNTFDFDKKHIDASDIVVMVMPAGKSAHLEIGYARGKDKPGYILFDKEPERVDIMYKFATDIFFNKVDLIHELRRYL